MRFTDVEIEAGIAHLQHGFMEPQVWREPKAWWCKLSAPGYMDQTDTAGPFSTEREAAEYLCETYADDIDECEECALLARNHGYVSPLAGC